VTAAASGSENSEPVDGRFRTVEHPVSPGARNDSWEFNVFLLSVTFQAGSCVFRYSAGFFLWPAASAARRYNAAADRRQADTE
jgi:hypothetical protein